MARARGATTAPNATSGRSLPPHGAWEGGDHTSATHRKLVSVVVGFSVLSSMSIDIFDSLFSAPFAHRTQISVRVTASDFAVAGLAEPEAVWTCDETRGRAYGTVA
eukprot:scaffold52164_cov75-Phaeocystis_antarctica.AAC.1